MPTGPTSISPTKPISESQRLELLGQIAASVAHDFGNILQAIQSVTRLIDKAADNPGEIHKLVQMLADATDGATQRIEKMLAFARGQCMDASSGEPPCNPAHAASRVCALLNRTLVPPHSLRCIVETDCLPTLVQGDQAEMDAAIMNLVFNARDAMPDGGEIVVQVAGEWVMGGTPGLKEGHYARVSVADSGAGMSAATRQRACQPFFTTKLPGKGTGLGLASVKAFAERAGGTLEIESEQGRGSVITFWLRAIQGMGRPKLKLFSDPAAVKFGTETLFAARAHRHCGRHSFADASKHRNIELRGSGRRSSS